MKKFLSVFISITICISIFSSFSIAIVYSKNVASEYSFLDGQECVAVARCFVPSLPYGLFTLDNKKAIINSYEPRQGAVAISTPNGDNIGHVA